jgi:hypothetical protein
MRLTTNRGAHFVDLKDHIDEKLVAVFDKISHDLNDFFYGRYDIMCNDIESLKDGTGFTILEYNGCGQSPIIFMIQVIHCLVHTGRF